MGNTTAAFAIQGHKLQRTIAAPCTTTPCPEGQLAEPAGLAINEETHIIYVADKKANRIDAYNATTGVFEYQFDGSGTNTNEHATKAPTPLTEPDGIAVNNSCVEHNPALTETTAPTCKEFDPSYGDVYIEDPSQALIDKFTATGEYITQITETEPSRPFDELDGVAVKANGLLLTYDFLSPQIAKYTKESPQNEFFEGFPSGGPPQPNPGFAVEPAGNDLYVVNSERIVSKLNASGGLLISGVFGEAAPGAGVLAVEASGDVYVDHGTAVGRYSSSGVPQETLGEKILGVGSGVAVSSAPASSITGSVFVADSSLGVIDVFALEEISAPTIQNESFGNVTAESVEVSGEVNPRGAASHYFFEYGPCATSSPSSCPASGYEKSVPALPGGELPADFEQHPVTASLEELTANTTYHFRLAASNEKGPQAGEELIFTTQAGGHELTMLDNRQWELVTPPNKYGALIRPIGEAGLIQAAASGNAISYLAIGPTEPQALSNSAPVQVLSNRGPAGWSSLDIAPPEYGPTIGAPLMDGPQRGRTGLKSWRRHRPNWCWCQ